jgi:hypothetical protein
MTWSNTSSNGLSKAWVLWCKSGHILQIGDKGVTAWDVKTHDISYEIIDFGPGLAGITAHAATGTLFAFINETKGQDEVQEKIQRYDVGTRRLVEMLQLPTVSNELEAWEVV